MYTFNECMYCVDLVMLCITSKLHHLTFLIHACIDILCLMQKTFSQLFLMLEIVLMGVCVHNCRQG